MSNREHEQAQDEIVDFGDGSFRIGGSVDNLTRRHVMTGLAAGAGTVGAATFGITPASAAIPGAGFAAEVLSQTFANVFSEVAAKAVLNSNIASAFTGTERDMEASGHRPRSVRGFRSAQRRGVITLDDGACFGVAADYGAGCWCVVLPPEVGVLRSCLDDRIGLPALYQRAGHQFGIVDVLRYVTVVRAERRRGRCGVSSLFHTWQGYVLEIEPYNACYARVEIRNPSTGKRLENPAVPTDPTNYKLAQAAGEWKIV